MSLRHFASSGPLLMAGLLALAGCVSRPPPAPAVQPAALMGSTSDAVVDELEAPAWAAMPSLLETTTDARAGTWPPEFGFGARATLGHVDWQTWAPPSWSEPYDGLLLGVDPTESVKQRALAQAFARSLKLRDAADRGASPITPDPLRRAFNPEGDDKHVPRDLLVPGTGSFDFGSARRGTAYGRLWRRGEEFGGVGIGFKLPAGRDWYFAGELGVDPDEQIDPNQVTLLLGISKGF